MTMRIGHDVVRALAEAEGVCVRPVLRRVTDRATGNATTVPIPCGSTREGVCRPCAIQARRLRMHQCSEGWHLAADPVSDDPELDGRSAELVDDLTDPVEPDTVVPEVAQPGDRRTRSTRSRRGWGTWTRPSRFGYTPTCSGTRQARSPSCSRRSWSWIGLWEHALALALATTALMK